MRTVLVRGSGDVGSAVAHMLHSAGFAVAVHDTERPSHPRRTMAFTDALFEGKAVLQGLLGKSAPGLDDLPIMMACRRAVPMTIVDFAVAIAAVRPDVVVDARMQKRSTSPGARGIAPVTIGLGPNFRAGENVDVAIETAWGEHLGAVLHGGATLAMTGEPRALGGHGRERFVYSPHAGTFQTPLAIGQRVQEGEFVGRVNAHDIVAPISGWLRGLSHDGAIVSVGSKVVEIDGTSGDVPRGLGERPRRIAAGVLEALGQG